MKFIAFFYYLLLRLRYNIKVINPEILRLKKATLFLPNHQASVDPQIIMSILLRRKTVAPMISEKYFNTPVLKQIFQILGAVSVSDLDAGSRDSNVLNTIKNAAIKALSDGKSILLYPSGQLSGQGYEKILNKQSAFVVAKELPENAQIVVVRVSGLWGSMWSRAWIGKSPSFIKTYLKAIGMIFSNLIFLSPRRKVQIEFQLVAKELLLENLSDRNTFNRFLESFHNKNGEEKPLFLKHFFFSPDLKRQLPPNIAGSVADLASVSDEKNIDISNEIVRYVKKILAEELKISSNNIDLSQNLALDLNLDSLGLVTVISQIESKYKNVKTPEITDIKKVSDLCVVAAGKDLSKRESLKSCELHLHSSPEYNVMPDPEKNILSNFLENFQKFPDEYFAWDATSGTSTRGGFMLKACVVSELIRKKVTGKYVGIMLPALQSTSLLIIASYMAGKIPVMLNWTVGKKILMDCVDLSGVNQIITAGTFYDKIAEQIPDELKSKLVFLDKEVKNIGFVMKVKGVLKAKFPKIFIQDKKIDSTAVVLFTSGSETIPKAVRLSHKNVVSDLWGALQIIDIRVESIFLSFLPPFHSFGFTVLSVLPLLTAVKVAYTPNPTDIQEVLRVLRHTKATNIIVTPTFLQFILNQASALDLRTVKLVISGAESLKAETKSAFQIMTQNRAIIIEGYGITECSPIVCLNPLDSQKLNSVGKFIHGLDYRIVHPETFNPIKVNEEGMIIVSGDSIFKGYLDSSIPSPFIEIDGKQFYKTGDLAKMDSEGFVFITGRLKRFLKIGGEMISLPSIEKCIIENFGTADKFEFAVEGRDDIETKKIVLFSLKNITLEEVNILLKKSGFSGLAKITDVVILDEIPILGSGKTDYRLLKSMIEA